MIEEQANQMMKVSLSLRKVVESYRSRLEEETNNFKRLYLSSILRYADENEELIEGIDPSSRSHFKEPINILLSELFPEALTHNEIKAATIPFSDVFFNKTKRLENIIKNAGNDFELKLMSANKFNTYRMACGLILNRIYNRNMDFTQPIFCSIPDINGNKRTYRITYNADFVEIEINEGYDKLTDDNIKELLRNPDDEQVWHKYFPVNSYTFKGFGIISFTDVTMDMAVSDLKTILLSSASGTDS
jgi:hypothetical protein